MEEFPKVVFYIDTTGWEAALTTLGFRARLLYLHLIYSPSLSLNILGSRIETDSKLDDGRPPKYSKCSTASFPAVLFSIFSFLSSRDKQQKII
jgi:hypothetical protein